MRVYDLTCRLEDIKIVSPFKLRDCAPRTIPPFHTTNTPNSTSTSEYGMNAGRISPNILGALDTDATISPVKKMRMGVIREKISMPRLAVRAGGSWS